MAARRGAWDWGRGGRRSWWNSESPIELGIVVPQLVSGPCPILSGPPPLVESHSHSKTQAFTTVPFPHGLGRRPVTAALQPWAPTVFSSLLEPPTFPGLCPTGPFSLVIEAPESPPPGSFSVPLLPRNGFYVPCSRAPRSPGVTCCRCPHTRANAKSRVLLWPGWLAPVSALYRKAGGAGQ